jgi:hypothetical protein
MAVNHGKVDAELRPNYVNAPITYGASRSQVSQAAAEPILLIRRISEIAYLA